MCVVWLHSKVATNEPSQHQLVSLQYIEQTLNAKSSREQQEQSCKKARCVVINNRAQH